MMKIKFSFFLLLILISSTGVAAEGFQNRPIINSIWAPTGHTLNQREFIVGLGSLTFGLNDNFQVGTNVILFLLQTYNINVKINWAETEKTALAAGFDYRRVNLSHLIDDDEYDNDAISPYIAFSSKVGKQTILHVTAKYRHFVGVENINQYKPSETVSGSEVFAGLEYAFSCHTRFLIDSGYDMTFDGIKLGGAVLFGWEKFRLKMGVSYYNPKNETYFTMPVIGLWWRFNG
jgi:hypothetical protein